MTAFEIYTITVILMILMIIAFTFMILMRIMKPKFDPTRYATVVDMAEFNEKRMAAQRAVKRYMLHEIEADTALPIINEFRMLAHMPEYDEEILLLHRQDPIIGVSA